MPRDLTSQERKDKVGNISLSTIKYKAGQWMRNIVMNETKIRESRGVNFLFDKLKDMPCILVGAGPSLDKNIHLLKECEGRSCIIACSSALVPLVKNNVMPHIVFITESKGTSKESFTASGVYEKSKDIILICDSFTHPSVWEDWKGEVMFYNIFPSDSFPMTYALPEFTGQIGSIGAGGSVTTVMLTLAHKGMKADPIIFVGQDCGYYDPNHDHAKGAKACVMEEMYVPEIVEDIYGKPCRTNKALLSFCYFLEDYVSSQSGTFINATEGGIFSTGVSLQKLEYTIEQHLKGSCERSGIMQILLDPNNIVDAAKLENRWQSIDNNKDKTTTYMPGVTVDKVLSGLYLEDYLEGLGSNHNIYPSFISYENIKKCLICFVDNIVNNQDISARAACHDEDHIEDSKYECIYSIDRSLNIREQKVLLNLLFEMNNKLQSHGILVVFNQDKNLLLTLQPLFNDITISSIKFNVVCSGEWACTSTNTDITSYDSKFPDKSLIINSTVSAEISPNGDCYFAIIKIGEPDNETKCDSNNPS